jgi:hypothetical protein
MSGYAEPSYFKMEDSAAGPEAVKQFDTEDIEPRRRKI